MFIKSLWHNFCREKIGRPNIMTAQEETPSLLLIYENATLGQIILEYMQRLGFKAQLADPNLSTEVKKSVIDREFDLCLMHLQGFTNQVIDVIHSLRELRDIPLFVSASDMTDIEKTEVMEMYKAGADDVITQPISMEIMGLKILAILRRCNQQVQAQKLFTIGSLTFDSELQTLSQDGVLIHHLSGKESELLAILMNNCNQLVERGYILRKIWGMDNYFNGRSLSVYINHLRHMLEVEQSVKILSIHGKGYKICIDDEVINISFREDI